MIAMAAIVKALHENSTLYLDKLSIKAFGELFCVSYYKAKSLLEMAKESEFFIYNEKKNCLFAKPFKSKFIITRGKRGQYKSAEDYVRKIDVVSEDSVFVNNREKITKVSLRKVVTILRRTLLHNVFSAEERNELVQEKKLSCNRFADLEKENEENTKRLLSLPLSDNKLPEQSMKSKIRELVNADANVRGVTQQDTWHRVYKDLYYLHGISINSYKKISKKETKLSIAERNGFLGKVFDIISNLVKEVN